MDRPTLLFMSLCCAEMTKLQLNRALSYEEQKLVIACTNYLIDTKKTRQQLAEEVMLRILPIPHIPAWKDLHEVAWRIAFDKPKS